MWEDAAQALRDAGKEFLKVEAGNQGISDVQEKPQTITFSSRLQPMCLGNPIVENVVKTYRHLIGSLLHEVEIRLTVGVLQHAAETQYTEVPLRRANRQNVIRLNHVLAQDFEAFWKPR